MRSETILSHEQLTSISADVQEELAIRSASGAFDENTDSVHAEIEDCIDYVTKYMDDLAEDDRAFIINKVVNGFLRYGALQPYLDDPSVTEIMVNAYDKVFIERQGIISRVTDEVFETEEEVKAIIDRIAGPLNKHIDAQTPTMDARLSDGSRVNAVLMPLSRFGTSLTIRKFPNYRLTGEDLIDMGTSSPEMMAFLECAVASRCNILVSGGTGTGKTTLLNVLSSFIPKDERVITIEDTAELKLDIEDIVSLEAREANADGKGAIDIHKLLVNALRMRPDRIIVGECRSTETVEMLQAMNTGHDGSLTTIHANDPRAAFLRIETLVQATQNLSQRNVDMQIATAIQLIVQIKRFRDGTRKISEIVALTGSMEGDSITTARLFEFVPEGVDENGFIFGRHVATGEALPEQIEERFERANVSFDPAWLEPVDGALW